MGCGQFLFPAAWPVLLLGVALQYIPLARAASNGNSGAQGQSCDPSSSTAGEGLQLQITPGQEQVVFNCGSEANKAELLPATYTTGECLQANCAPSPTQTLANVCTAGAKLTASGNAVKVYTFSITPPATKECQVCYTCSIPPHSLLGEEGASAKTCNVKISVVTSSSTTKPTNEQPDPGASPGPSNQTPGTPAPQDSPGGGTAPGGDQQDSSSTSQTLGGSSLLAGVVLCFIHMSL